MEKDRMDRQTLLRWAAERHARAVYNLCLGVLRDPADAEDAAQEAFAALARDVDGIRDASSFRPWLLKAALRICWKSSARSRRRDRTRREAPAMRKETEDVLSWVKEAVEALPEAQRLPLMLRYYQGLEYAEIADVLDCPEGSVSARLREGLAGLRMALPAGLAALTLASLEEALGAVPQAPVPAGLAASLGNFTAASAVAGVATGGAAVAKAKIYASVAVLMVLGGAGEAWRRDHARLSEELEDARRAVPPARVEKAPEPVQENAALKAQLAALQEQVAALEGERRSVQAPVLAAPEGDLDGVQELADRIARLDRHSSAAEASKLINRLVASGERALPAIRTLLASGKNLRYVSSCEPGKAYGECPTLRAGLLNALRQIGGSEAARISLASLPDAQDNLEVFEISQALVQAEGSVQAHRAPLLAALKKQLDSEPARRKAQEERQREAIRKYQALAQTYGGEERIPPEAAEAFQKEMALLGVRESLDIFSLELDMIHQLGGVKELAAELEQAGRSGEGRSRDRLSLLATALEPAAALQALQRVYEARKAQPSSQRSDVLGALAQIQSPEAEGYIRQIYPGLSSQDKVYLIEGLMVGLNMTGGGTSRIDPFVKGFDYRHRRPAGARPVTPATAESALRLLRDLEALTLPADEIRAERKRLEEWMQDGSLYRSR